MKSGIERRWFLPALVLMAAFFVWFISARLGAPAIAQARFEPGVDGDVVAIPIQMGRDSYGLAMMDKTTETLWIYEINGRGPAHGRLRLFAARSWRYDKLLQQYNTAAPKPEQVKKLVEDLGAGLKQPNNIVQKEQKTEQIGEGQQQ